MTQGEVVTLRTVDKHLRELIICVESKDIREKLPSKDQEDIQ